MEKKESEILRRFSMRMGTEPYDGEQKMPRGRFLLLFWCTKDHNITENHLVMPFKLSYNIIIKVHRRLVCLI